MYKVSYYHADTGDTDWSYKVKLESAKAELDRFIDNGPGNVRRVSALRVDFTNGDFARITDMNPLCPLMLDREDRGFDNDGSDSIFV